MNRNAFITCGHYLNNDGSYSIGGIQTYIQTLSTVLKEMGYSVHIYQYSNRSFEIEKDNTVVHGVNTGNREAPKLLMAAINRKIDNENDLLIFGTDYEIASNKAKHSIAIQHGIAWDICKQEEVSYISNILAIGRNALGSIVKYNRYKKSSNLVCVDYNFVNWYRTQVKHIDNALFVIPNFAHVEQEIAQREGPVSVIFARRFVEYRGTRIFADAIKQVLADYPAICVTLAGEGPDEKWLKNNLADYPQVKFICFTAEESVAVHSKHHIAVVPTWGSEGTSLSLLEAMAAGCAVICTNVGGMTNIVIDGYNGKIVNPDVQSLVAAIEKLIADEALRQKIAQHGNETVQYGFSYDKWKSAWMDTIKVIQCDGKRSQ